MQDIKHRFLCIWQRKKTKDCYLKLRFMSKYGTNLLKWDPILSPVFETLTPGQRLKNLFVVKNLYCWSKHIGHFYRLKEKLTYHSRFIPEGVADTSQIHFQDTHILPKWISLAHHRLIVTYSGVNAVNRFYYNIHGRNEDVLFFSSVPDTTQD
jgi:hypothetical protein